MVRRKKEPKFTSILKHFLWLKIEETWFIWILGVLPVVIGYLLPWPVSPFFEAMYTGHALTFIVAFESWMKGLVVLAILAFIFGFLVWLNSNWRRAKEIAKDELSDSGESDKT